MASILGAGRPVELDQTVPPEPPDGPPRMTDWVWRDILAWTKLVLCVVLGVALGAVNLTAFDAPGLLRIPALLAALILCAQGPVDLEEHLREKDATIEAETEALRQWYADQRRKDEEERRRHEAAEEGAPSLKDRLHVRVVDSGDGGESLVEAETKSLQQQAKKQEAGAVVRAGAVADSRGGLLTVLILAVWLGLATLNYPQSPPLLLWLSLIASFLLFVSVWGGLQKRPT